MTEKSFTLDQRVRRLEKQNKMLSFAVAGLLVLGLIAAADGPEISRAHAFQLIDQDGNVRAELAFRDGAPGLYVKDEDGKDRLAAAHDADGTGLFIKDDQGTTRIGVAQFAHGGGGVALHGPGSKGAAVLYLKGQGSLRFFDAEGKVTRQVLATDGESGGR